jgi:ATP-dependent Lon protease
MTGRAPRLAQVTMSEEGQLVAEYRRRIRNARMPSRIRDEAFRQLARLTTLPTGSFDHYMVRGYLEAVIEVPWQERADAERRFLATAPEPSP